MILVRVAGVALDPTGQHVILLKPIGEIAGEGRLLPIWIGAQEATSILVAVERADVPRPLAHEPARVGRPSAHARGGQRGRAPPAQGSTGRIARRGGSCPSAPGNDHAVAVGVLRGTDRGAPPLSRNPKGAVDIASPAGSNRGMEKRCGGAPFPALRSPHAR